MINIPVCVKIVDGDLNPFDACAIEEALKIDDAYITIISMGPKSWESRLRFLTRLGVNRVILLSDTAFAGSDTMATSYALSLALKKIRPDLVICGRQAIDGDTAQTPPSLSEKLGMSIISNVLKINSIDNGYVSCDTRCGKTVKSLPCVITVERINTLRLPKIRSKEKDIEIWNSEYIGADKNKCGIIGSPTRVIKTFEAVRDKRKCRFLQPSEFIPLISELRTKEIKIASDNSIPYLKKLNEIYIVGKELYTNASEIAKNVVILDRMPPEATAQIIKKANAKYVLWPADLWGRENAPIVASILKTGLCADCTYLESDGENLIMYRPAKSGSITAKIKCLTYPQMATVRIKDESSEVIISFGAGISSAADNFEILANKIGADIGASRKLVDSGYIDYSKQIGLTGKSICAKIYIAIGISGTVQHTCAISGCENIIAVNPDKNARIFECADYGFVCNGETIIDLIKKIL